MRRITESKPCRECREGAEVSWLPDLFEAVKGFVLPMATLVRVLKSEGFVVTEIVNGEAEVKMLSPVDNGWILLGRLVKTGSPKAGWGPEAIVTI